VRSKLSVGVFILTFAPAAIAAQSPVLLARNGAFDPHPSHHHEQRTPPHIQ
jgi:hypothetical protein